MDTFDFEKIKPLVIPHFVKVYGEKYRDLIESRLNNVTVLVGNSLEQVDIDIAMMKRQKLTELTESFLKRLGIEVSSEILSAANERLSFEVLKKTSPEIYRFIYYCFDQPIYRPHRSNLLSYLLNENFDLAYLENSLKILSCLGVNIEPEDYNEWIKSDEAKPVLHRISEIKKVMEELDGEYQKFVDSLAPLTKKKKELDEERKRIEITHYIKMLSSFRFKMSLGDKRILYRLKKLLNEGADVDIIQKCINSCTFAKLLGTRFYFINSFEGFTEEAEEILKKEPVDQNKRKTIIELRERYFDFVKSDHHYENMMVDHKFAEEALEVKKKFYFMAKLETLKKFTSFESIKKQLMIVGLQEAQANREAFRFFETNTSYVKAFIYEDGDNVKIKPVVYFAPWQSPLFYRDIVFIHELNHAIEMCITKIEEGKTEYKSGFEICESGHESEVGKNGKRPYELLSESFDELIAKKVTESMHEAGIFIFDDPKNARVWGGNDNERSIEFISDMWDTFGSEVLSARSTTSMDTLFSTVGRDNFEDMSNLFNDYGMVSPFDREMQLQDPDSPYQMEFANFLRRANELNIRMKNFAQQIKSENQKSHKSL